MAVDAPLISATDASDDASERGAVFALAAAILIVLIGMAAYAVDLGWIYLSGIRAEKAAEAAALAGVVHMPRPTDQAFNTTEAYLTAIEIAGSNGYVDGVNGVIVTPKESLDITKKNQLEVEVDVTINTFFMKLFGFDTVDLSRSAVAEALPPLKLGNDRSFFGNQPPGGDPAATNPNFWVAVNGEFSPKNTGDPYSVRCLNNNSTSLGVGCDLANNTVDYRSPNHYYGIDVSAADVAAGAALVVKIYDGNWQAGRPSVAGLNSVHADEWGIADMSFNTTFRVLEPDNTPNDPSDNTLFSTCSTTFDDPDPDPVETPVGSGIYLPNGTGIQTWVTICNAVLTRSGLYLLEVDSDLGGGSNGFSIDVDTVGGPDDPAVFGFQSMSIYMIQEDVTAAFKLAKVEQIYAGRELRISLFDPGDIALLPGQSSSIVIAGEGLPFGCEWRSRDNLGNQITPWVNGGTPCTVLVSDGGINYQRFNDQWLDLRFQLPPGYACATDCWWEVAWGVPAGATPTERTTWVVTVGGTPIRLVD